MGSLMDDLGLLRFGVTSNPYGGYQSPKAGCLAWSGSVPLTGSTFSSSTKLLGIEERNGKRKRKTTVRWSAEYIHSSTLQT